MYSTTVRFVSDEEWNGTGENDTVGGLRVMLDRMTHKFIDAASEAEAAKREPSGVIAERNQLRQTIEQLEKELDVAKQSSGACSELDRLVRLMPPGANLRRSQNFSDGSSWSVQEFPDAIATNERTPEEALHLALCRHGIIS